MAYWQRGEELLGLLDGASQRKMLQAAKQANLGRHTLRRFRDVLESGSVEALSLADAHRIADRYALWTVRAKFDWGRYPPEIDRRTRQLDERLCSGIYDLDVRLRRQIEGLLLSRKQDRAQADHLRSTVEARAGQTAAALDIAKLSDPFREEWDDIAESYDPVCNELHLLLTLAGSPGDYDDAAR